MGRSGPRRSTGATSCSRPTQQRLFRVRIEGSGQRTEIYCGFLGSTTPKNMLLRSLPSIMVVHLDDAAESAWIKRSLDFAVRAQQGFA